MFMFPMLVYEKNIYSKTRIWSDINRLIEDRTNADFVFRIEASWHHGYPPVWTVSTDGDFDGAFWKDFDNCQEALLCLDSKLSQLIYDMYDWAKGNYDNPNPIARGEAKDILEVLKKHNWIEKEKGELNGKREEEAENSTTNTQTKES